MTAHPPGLGSMTRDELEAWAAANPAEAQTYVALHAQYRKQLAATDPNTFAEWVAVDEGTGEPIRQAPHHEEMHRLVSAHDLLVLWAHIESGKSTQITGLRVVYELGRNPNLRVAIVSNTQEQAIKLATPARRLIEDESGRVREVFPKLRPSRKRWTDASFTVERSRPSKDPSVQCFGVHGAVLGARIDLLVLDDILDFENTRTPEGRKALLQWVRSTLFGRLTKRAKVIVLGTAWHPDDLLHALAKQDGWHSARFAVQDEATGLPTWPEVWPLDRIRAAIKRLGPLEAARQLFCRARSDEDARFKQEWIDTCLARGEGRTMPYRLARVPEGYRVVTGVDLGTREKRARGKQADTTTLFTLCVHPNGDREVLCVERGRWHAPEIVRRIKDAHARYGSTVYVESNAAQDYLRQFIVAESALPILPFNTGANKMNPEFGVESIAVELFNAKWIIPSAGGRSTLPVEQWIGEMLAYTPGAHTGDALMACWFAREGARSAPVEPPPVQTGRIDLHTR